MVMPISERYYRCCTYFGTSVGATTYAYYIVFICLPIWKQMTQLWWIHGLKKLRRKHRSSDTLKSLLTSLETSTLASSTSIIFLFVYILVRLLRPATAQLTAPFQSVTENDNKSENNHKCVQIVILYVVEIQTSRTEMWCTFVSNHILWPIDHRLNGGHRLIAISLRHGFRIL